MTTESVAESMELVNNWKSLEPSKYRIGRNGVIPDSRLTEIQQRCSTRREIANECASYYVHCHPQPSWTHLASQLYREGEFAAVEKLKSFLPLRGKYIMLIFTCERERVCMATDNYAYSIGWLGDIASSLLFY